MNLNQLYCQESLHLLDASMNKINHCLAQLSAEQVWWRPSKDTNSIGNLLLHMAGNLRQWGVIPFSGEADDRDREAEFAATSGLDGTELIAVVQQAVADTKAQVENLSAEKLCEAMIAQGFSTTALGAITHTTSHFVGHAHQIILLARMQLGDAYKFEWSLENRGFEAGDVPL